MGLRDELLNEPISSLTLRNISTIDADSTVRQAIDAMREIQVGCVLIPGDDGKSPAMFNEKLLIRLLANGGSVDEPVKNHVTSNVVCLKASDSIAKLIATMQEHKLRWVCLADDDGNVTHLTGLKGVVEYVADNHSRQVMVQPLQSKLSMDQREGA